MSLIQVIKGEKGSFRVLVNYVQFGCALHSPVLANKHAEALKSSTYPTATLILIAIEEKAETRK